MKFPIFMSIVCLGWDPYADYGEWEGEPIEIINSNASIAMGMEEAASLETDIFQDSGSECNK